MPGGAPGRNGRPLAGRWQPSRISAERRPSGCGRSSRHAAAPHPGAGCTRGSRSWKPGQYLCARCARARRCLQDVVYFFHNDLGQGPFSVGSALGGGPAEEGALSSVITLSAPAPVSVSAQKVAPSEAAAAEGKEEAPPFEAPAGAERRRGAAPEQPAPVDAYVIATPAPPSKQVPQEKQHTPSTPLKPHTTQVQLPPVPPQLCARGSYAYTAEEPD